MTDRLALPRHYRDQLKYLLREHVPGVEVWAYGNRVNGESHDGSDLDLVLRGPALEPLDGGFYDLLEAIEKSNIPILIQAHDWAMLPESFHREIERDYVVVQEEVGKQTAASGWRKVRLGDVMSFANGRSSPERSDDSLYPVYGSNGTIGKSNEMNADANTIVIGRVGSYCGSLHFSNENCWITDNAIQAKAVGENDSKFFFFLLHSLGLNELRSGSGQPLLNQTILSSIPTVIPPLPTQRAIAHILGTLDDKIELNRRMNEMLEEMVRALFKSWFVDFDPVRAKMEGRWRRGESLPGLPAEHYDLFPDRLVDSELGEIPEGWEVAMVGEIANHRRSVASPQEIDADTPYIALEHMPKRCIALSEWSTAAGLASNKFRFEQGDILFGKLRPYFHKVGVAPLDGVCSTDIVVISPVSQDWFGFLLGHVSGQEFIDYTNAGSTGTRMPRTSWPDMARYKIAVPGLVVARAYTATLQPAIERILTASHESRTLATQRDALLPRLVSGEVGVIRAG